MTQSNNTARAPTVIAKTLRLLPNWLGSYLEYTAAMEAPDRMHFWTGVSTVAGALRRKVWIDQKYFQWTPNFYIVLVAPAGVVSKSSTADVGMRLLRQVDEVRFGPSSITWQALIQSMAEALDMVNLPDAGGAGVFGPQFPMSCLTISSSELGSFLNPHDREMIDVLTDLWDSKLGMWDKKTKFSGAETIENPWINFIGCTTPSWMKTHLPEYVIGGGLMSRIVLVFAREKRKLCAYPFLDVHPDHDERGDALVHDLRHIATLAGEYTLTPEAIAWGDQWYEKHWNAGDRPHYLFGERFGGYLARKQTHIHKLAMVLAASQSDSMVITHQILAMADNLVSTLEPDLAEAFESIGGTPPTKLAAEVLAVARAYGRISRDALYRVNFNRMTKSEFDEAIDGAISAGYARQRMEGDKIWIYAEKAPQEPSDEP